MNLINNTLYFLFGFALGFGALYIAERKFPNQYKWITHKMELIKRA